MHKKILMAFCQRLPWNTARNILSDRGFLTSTGQDNTISKIMSWAGTDTVKLSAIESLQDIYKSIVLYNDKVCRFYDINQDYHGQIVDIVCKLKPTKSLYTKSFPFQISGNDLAKIDNGSYITEKIDSDSYCDLVICTKRYYTERYQLSASHLKVPEDYDQILAFKKHNKQFFDRVRIYKDIPRVDFYIDHGTSIKSRDIDRTIQDLKTAFEIILFKNGLDASCRPLNIALNLFPIISKVYDNRHEGFISKLGFITPEGSVKHESMKRHSKDLRSELYHKAGRKAVKKIDPFRITVFWSQKTNKETQTPVLEINGNSNILFDERPVLNNAIISGCIYEENYDFILGKISHYYEQA